MNHGLVDAVEFKVNKPLSLHGLLLYGHSKNQFTYNVEVKIMSANDIVLLHILLKKIKDSCKIFK